jgi:L-amino acid N-acyltransferase YncA
MTVTIRPYQPDDLEHVQSILNQIIERGDALVYDSALSAEETRRWIESYAICNVAVMGGRLVGAYVLKPNQSGRGLHVSNATYMVAAEARGHGIGRLLGEHSLKTAKDMGFSAMQFNAVVSNNNGAVVLWQKLGFTIIGTVPQAFRHANGRLVDLHVMHRFL